MESKIEQILAKIEELRTGLENMLNTKSTADKEVIEASRALDKMLNNYHKMLKEKQDWFSTQKIHVLNNF